jgi:hypothetical protein
MQNYIFICTKEVVIATQFTLLHVCLQKVYFSSFYFPFYMLCEIRYTFESVSYRFASHNFSNALESGEYEFKVSYNYDSNLTCSLSDTYILRSGLSENKCAHFALENIFYPWSNFKFLEMCRTKQKINRLKCNLRENCTIFRF